MHPDLHNAVAQARISDFKRSADAGLIAADSGPRRSPLFARLKVAQTRLTSAMRQMSHTLGSPPGTTE